MPIIPLIILYTSDLMSYFNDTNLTYEDVRVGIFGYETGYHFYFATTSSAAAIASTSSINAFMAGNGTMYSVYGYADADADGISVIAASATTSYDRVMNSASNAPGYYAGYNTQSTIGEAVLSADGEFTMYVHNFDTLTYDADALMTVTTGSAVPVPAAVWLLGSGLLGAIGIRRLKA